MDRLPISESGSPPVAEMKIFHQYLAPQRHDGVERVDSRMTQARKQTAKRTILIRAARTPESTLSAKQDTIALYPTLSEQSKVETSER
jgi:hypothetical protein